MVEDGVSLSVTIEYGGMTCVPLVPCCAEVIEVATHAALIRLLDSGGADVMVLDGEAQPAGGMGVCRQAKDELYDCPPVLLIIARADDGWLATWSRADAVVSHPIDPAALANALAGLMRQRAAGVPAQA